MYIIYQINFKKEKVYIEEKEDKREQKEKWCMVLREDLFNILNFYFLFFLFSYVYSYTVNKIKK